MRLACGAQRIASPLRPFQVPEIDAKEERRVLTYVTYASDDRTLSLGVREGRHALAVASQERF